MPNLPWYFTVLFSTTVLIVCDFNATEIFKRDQSPNFKTFKEPKNRFQGTQFRQDV